ncbi:MAG: methyltransferase [Acidimicrobiales bacterium]|nr:MAG: methyltransferase [Acidimicrobiales bacterium]
MDDSFGWDEVAAAYADEFGDELSAKPFDRRMLDRLAERASPIGPLCDLGCGPGQIAAYLHSSGHRVAGIDLSPEMVRQANRCHPDIDFAVGDMADLSEVPDKTFGGVAAFYSIVNIPEHDHEVVFGEIARVLRPAGWLLLSFHVGEETRLVEEFLGSPVRLTFYFFAVERVRERLESAGLEVVEAMQREPYPESVEARTTRAYLFAQRPA